MSTPNYSEKEERDNERFDQIVGVILCVLFAVIGVCLLVEMNEYKEKPESLMAGTQVLEVHRENPKRVILKAGESHKFKKDAKCGFKEGQWAIFAGAGSTLQIDKGLICYEV